jgi:hypothetical protein
VPDAGPQREGVAHLRARSGTRGPFLAPKKEIHIVYIEIYSII